MTKLWWCDKKPVVEITLDEDAIEWLLSYLPSNDRATKQLREAAYAESN